MGARWNVLLALAAIAGVVLVGLVWLRPVRQPPREIASAPAADEPQGTAETNPPPHPRLQRAEVVSSSAVSAEPAPVAAAPSALLTNWEDMLDQTLTADTPTDAKARQMLDMFPRLPADGQVEVAKHLCNLVSDQDYSRLAQFLADPHLPQDALDTLMADALNRPNSLKLPALLEVARTPEHPKAGEAKEVLGFLLEADYGDDWAKWQDKVQDWLKDNPD